MTKRKMTASVSALLALILLQTAVLSGCGKDSTDNQEAAFDSIIEPIPVEESSQTASDNKPVGAEGSETAAETGAESAPGAESAASAQPAPAESAASAESTASAEPAASTSAAAPAARQPGERFEAVIYIEGMDETVKYEHIRNETAGFEMDYDYESFTRRSEADGECFVSVYDNPDAPENYLEVKYYAEDANTVIESVKNELSKEYSLYIEPYELDYAGTCTRIDASADVTGKNMPDILKAVYVIPASDGCRVATASYFIVGSEGFGKRFSSMVKTIQVINKQGKAENAQNSVQNSAQDSGMLTEDEAVFAVRNYCLINDPTLQGIIDAGETPVYWDISSHDEKEIVVVYRSYTGALLHYYINPVTGDTYVTEFVPGITPEEERTDEQLNIRNYLN